MNELRGNFNQAWNNEFIETAESSNSGTFKVKITEMSYEMVDCLVLPLVGIG